MGRTQLGTQKLEGGQEWEESLTLAGKFPAQVCRPFLLPLTCGEASTFNTVQKQAGIEIGVCSLNALFQAVLAMYMLHHRDNPEKLFSGKQKYCLCHTDIEN